MTYIGLDIGTSGCKAAVVDKEAGIIAMAHAEYELLFPQKGFVELDSAEIYKKVKSVLKELAPYAGDAEALSIASFGEAFVLLDENEQPLNHFITYADNRCEGMDQEIMQQMPADRIFAVTGVYPNQSFSLCKLLWLKKYKPELMKKAKSLFFANDYYNYLLSGKRGVDCGTASKSLLADIHKKDWSEEMLGAFDIPVRWFSPILKVGTLLGPISGNAAAETGLSRRIQIYLGCHDQCSATLGGGACSAGSIMIGEGSTESINLVTDSRIFEHTQALTARKMCVEPFVGDELYMLAGGFLTYGNAIRWYLRTMEKERQKMLDAGTDIFQYLEASCQSRTELVCLPYLSGVNLMNPDEAVPGAFVGLSLETEKWEFYRALIQGLNFESKHNLERMEEIGVPLDSISAGGGITKSDLFMQLKADVLQKELSILQNEESGIIGLAMICAVALGECSTYQEAASQYVRIKKIVRPKAEYTKEYIHYNQLKTQLSKSTQ